MYLSKTRLFVPQRKVWELRGLSHSGLGHSAIAPDPALLAVQRSPHEADRPRPYTPPTFDLLHQPKPTQHQVAANAILTL